MTDKWYIAEKGKGYGPFKFDQLQQLASTGLLRESDLVWEGGSGESQMAGTIDGLFANRTKRRPAQSSKPFLVAGSVMFGLVLLGMAFFVFRDQILPHSNEHVGLDDLVDVQLNDDDFDGQSPDDRPSLQVAEPSSQPSPSDSHGSRVPESAVVDNPAGSPANAIDRPIVEPRNENPHDDGMEAVPALLVELAELNAEGSNFWPWVSPDGLSIYWTRSIPGTSPEIWYARRANVSSPFASGAARLLEGMYPSLSSDQNEMVFLRSVPTERQLGVYVATRRNTNDSFSRPRLLEGLIGFLNPTLSHDGLSLILTKNQTAFVSSRRSRDAEWSMPVEVCDGKAIKLYHPFLTADSLGLYCTGFRDGRGMWMYRSQRSSVDDRFAAMELIDFAELGLEDVRGERPCLVEVTKELFFNRRTPMTGEGKIGLWVVKGFR